MGRHLHHTLRECVRLQHKLGAWGKHCMFVCMLGHTCLVGKTLFVRQHFVCWAATTLDEKLLQRSFKAENLKEKLVVRIYCVTLHKLCMGWLSQKVTAKPPCYHPYFTRGDVHVSGARGDIIAYMLCV